MRPSISCGIAHQRQLKSCMLKSLHPRAEGLPSQSWLQLFEKPIVLRTSQTEVGFAKKAVQAYLIAADRPRRAEEEVAETATVTTHLAVGPGLHRRKAAEDQDHPRRTASERTISLKRARSSRFSASRKMAQSSRRAR
jgi:hypothetical protein